MQGGFQNPPVGNQGTLTRPAIKSPNFVDSVSGWQIARDGSAEFNNLELRGTFLGTDYIINSAGAFFYSGAPATGNLILSIAGGPSSTDGFGNHYVGQALAFYSSTVAVVIQNGAVAWFNGSLSTGWSSTGPILQEISGGKLSVQGPIVAGAISALTSAEVEVQGPLAADSLWIPSLDIPVASAPTGVENWHAMSLLNGWANAGAPAPNAQYRLIGSPPLSVEIIGSLASAASTAVVIASLPAAYRPASTIRFPVELIVGTAPAAGTNMFGSVVAGGNVSLFNIPTVAGDTVDFHALISLDA